ncbi:acyl transferase [Laspinema olomoucense]|uniref:Acyl transferase n=1 Tax=Laspinema olomoucense D3b TaxID=2953688 RepID=A0ABT2NJX0_9CYAN|nr:MULTISPECIES: acyl transferase [unclassified Laspinema]MCT7981591.1 acyl transferase [Laspinema sp. D3b]MCT7987804.1 acyl transferase [Laspinema sp. D3a]MCT7992813.1 acyl transferase [Laspinema sp. D3c]
MTLLSLILSFFPAIVMGMTAASLLWICLSPGILGILALLFSLYGFPVIIYRIHQYFYPLKEGISYLKGRDYSPWWGSHQIQTIYITFPALESALRLIPGAFSLWLRFWGAKIGRGIYWMPILEIADRGLLEVGDRTIVGHRVGIYSHVIKPKHNNLILYVKAVKIGNDVFVGSGTHFGPGVSIADGAYLPIATHLYPNTKVNPRHYSTQ